MNMIGNDFKKLMKSNPAVERASARVGVINQAANLMRHFRIGGNFSQESMAEKLRVSQPRIAQLESGKPGSAPSLEQIADYAHYTGHSVSVCDSAKVFPPSERDELLGQIRALKSTNHRLEIENARLRNAEKVGYTMQRTRDIGELGLQLLHVKRPHAATTGDTVIVPVAVDRPAPQRTMGLGAKSYPQASSGDVVIFTSKKDDVVVIGAKENLAVSELAAQWNRVVSKPELREIAQSIVKVAKEQNPIAYDLFSIIIDAMNMRLRP